MATKKSSKRGASGGSRRRPADRKWSAGVTKHSNALDLEQRVFSWKDPRRIAASLKRSA